MYNYTEWLDEVRDEDDHIIQPGTNQSAANFNNLECGVVDAHAALALLLNLARQNMWRIEDLERATVQEVGTTTLTNSETFPFNNSQKTVALSNTRDNQNYVVVIVSVTGTGNVGEIEVTDRLVNGFKIAHTGSAKSVSVSYAVIGGYN